MFEVAVLMGIYSYLVFALGLIGLLYKKYLFLITVAFVLFGLRKVKIVIDIKEKLKKDRLSCFLIILLFFQAVVNLIGALGPELGFDALWYHLTLPKIYLQNHKIVFIPGNLLYYSAMPKLIEMLYIPALAFGGEILAKLIHFGFGILSALSLYRLARRYLNPATSLICVTIFYSALVVGWQSITAYVDLGRTFFEILALDYFLRWFEKQNDEDLKKSAGMAGLAISTKLLALGSLLIFLALILLKDKKIFKYLIIYSFLSFGTSFPWFAYSFIHTKNPIYPLFLGILDSSHRIVSFNLLRFLSDFWKLFLFSADPLNPLILIFFPLVFLYFKKISSFGKILFLYCFLTYSVWYFIPRTGGGRFFLPYLPAWSLACGLILDLVSNKKIKKFLIFFVFLFCLVNLSYRGMANKKFIPVILGKQSKDEFLTLNLNFQFGDFYDVDGFFKENIQKDDLVLIYGIHNLYYVDFPFVHESWAKSGVPVTHILVKDGDLPKKIGKRRLIYSQPKTNVRLYLFGEKIP